MGWDVIVRSFRGVVVQGHEAEFYRIVRERLIVFRRTFRIVESHIGRRMTPDGDTFLITTLWPDWASLRQWGDEDLERPWGFEEIMPHLVSWRIEHFEEFAAPTEQAVDEPLPETPAQQPAADRDLSTAKVAV